MPWELLSEQPGTFPAQLPEAEPMFHPLPAGNRAEEVAWLGRRAAAEPGCWAKRDRTATRSGNNAGVSQGRGRIAEVLNLACVEVDTGEAKAGPTDRKMLSDIATRSSFMTGKQRSGWHYRTQCCHLHHSAWHVLFLRPGKREAFI